MRRLSVQWLHGLGLRRTLLLLLVPGMLTLAGIEFWLTWRTAVDAANSAYDRSVLGAIKAIDANISTASGGLGVELPYVMLEFFELTAAGQVFFRVATEDGLVEIGSADLPQPEQALATGRPLFGDGTYIGEAIRIGSYARLLDPPLAGQPAGQRVVIQVAETLGSRQEFIRRLVLDSVARVLGLIMAAMLLLVVAVAWALRPLSRLRGEVEARQPGDLAPISATGVPADVRPLVEAINHHVERSRRQGEARRRFVDDASHQLRTPLTTLTTQVGFALRAQDEDARQEALLAIKSQLDETVRQANQMLALARTDTVELEPEPVELVEHAETVTRRWWSEARERRIDLGFEAPPHATLWVAAQPALLQEALSNLLHNALRYTPAGGSVTVVVKGDGSTAVLCVVDNGPGIPEAERSRAGERFFRSSNASVPGTGLGLAIVRSIAERHGGELRIGAGPDGAGLAVSIVLPLMAAPPTASPAAATRSPG